MMSLNKLNWEGLTSNDKISKEIRDKISDLRKNVNKRF